MDILAIVAVGAALAWTVVVIGGNAMSDAVGEGFEAGWTEIPVAWLVAIACVAAWWLA